jgi:hypothetical protein
VPPIFQNTFKHMSSSVTVESRLARSLQGHRLVKRAQRRQVVQRNAGGRHLQKARECRRRRRLASPKSAVDYNRRQKSLRHGRLTSCAWLYGRRRLLLESPAVTGTRRPTTSDATEPVSLSGRISSNDTDGPPSTISLGRDVVDLSFGSGKEQRAKCNGVFRGGLQVASKTVRQADWPSASNARGG